MAAIARGVAAGGRTASVVDLNPGSVALPILLGAEPAGDLAAVLAALGAIQPDADRPPDPDEPVDPQEAHDTQPLASAELLDGICAPAGVADISLIAYPPTGPLPEAPSAAAARALLGHLANRAHVVLVAGLHDPDVRAAIMQQADARVLLYEPTLPSISAAVHCLALLGAESPTVLVQSHPRMRRSTLSQAQIRYALAERRPDVIIPFEPTLHATATGAGRNRPPRQGIRRCAARSGRTHGGRSCARRVMNAPRRGNRLESLRASNDKPTRHARVDRMSEAGPGLPGRHEDARFASPVETAPAADWGSPEP